MGPVNAKAAPVARASFTRRERRKRTRSTTPTRLASSTTTARVASEEMASAAPLALAPSGMEAFTVIVGASTTSIAPRREAYRRWPSSEAASPVTVPPALTPATIARLARSMATMRRPAAT